MPGYPQLLACQHGAGTLFSSYTTAKSVINPQALYQVPPNDFRVGDYLHVYASGGVSSVVTSQRTFTFQVMMGSIAVFTTGAQTTTTTAHVIIPFKIDVWLRLDTEGSGTTAKFMGQSWLGGQMWVYSGASTDAVTGLASIMAPNTAQALGTGFDSSIANILDFWTGLSASEATTGIQINHYAAMKWADRN